MPTIGTIPVQAWLLTKCGWWVEVVADRERLNYGNRQIHVRAQGREQWVSEERVTATMPKALDGQPVDAGRIG